MKKKINLEMILSVWGWIGLVWFLYRRYLVLPEWADEFIFKPLVFVVPVIWFVRKIEKRPLISIGLTFKNFFNNLYLGIGFGFIFALEGLFVNIIKHGDFRYNPIAAVNQYGLIWLLILSLATSISEEILSRGFIFSRIYEKRKQLFFAAFVSTLLFVMLHIPILITSLKFTGIILVLFFVTDFILGFANALLFYNTGSLVAPILIHLFWNMTVALYL